MDCPQLLSCAAVQIKGLGLVWRTVRRSEGGCMSCVFYCQGLGVYRTAEELIIGAPLWLVNYCHGNLWFSRWGAQGGRD